MLIRIGCKGRKRRRKLGLARRWYRSAEAPAKEILPERALLAAIINRAIQDYYCINLHGMDNVSLNRRTAWKWFIDQSFEAWSFRWTCQQLGYDELQTTMIRDKVLSGDLNNYLLRGKGGENMATKKKAVVKAAPKKPVKKAKK